MTRLDSSAHNTRYCRGGGGGGGGMGIRSISSNKPFSGQRWRGEGTNCKLLHIYCPVKPGAHKRAKHKSLNYR